MKQASHQGGARTMQLSALRESPLNPRRLFSPLELEDLAASIKRHGIIEPLVVRQAKGHFEVIAGARRLRAAAIAKLTAVPVVVRQASDDEVRELMLVENLQRANLNAVDECESYWQLVEDRGYTGARIAESIGKSPAHVYARMKLRELAPEARSALAEGRITVSHALLLASQPVATQRKALKVRTDNQGPSQLTVADLKKTLHPHAAPKKVPGQAVYDVVSKCWRCNTPLEYGTDRLGRTLVECRPCLKEIRELQDQVRRLTAQLKERVAA